MKFKIKSIFLLCTFIISLLLSTINACAAEPNKVEKYWWGSRSYIDVATTPEIIDALDHEFRTGSNAGGGFASLVLGGILGLFGGAIGAALVWRVNTGIDYAVKEMKNLNRQGKAVILEFVKLSITFKVCPQ